MARGARTSPPADLNRGGGPRVRIHLDAENYRAKREQSLQHLARKVAGKVIRYRRSVPLEPMNAYERHVIHTALQDFEGDRKSVV